MHTSYKLKIKSLNFQFIKNFYEAFFIQITQFYESKGTNWIT